MRRQVKVFDENFKDLRKLKQELREDDDELRELLNRKNVDFFELDSFMNKW